MYICERTNLVFDRVHKIKEDDRTAIYSSEYLGDLGTSNSSWIDILEKIFEGKIYRPSEHPYGRAFDIVNNKTSTWIYNNATYRKKYGRGGFYHIEF